MSAITYKCPQCGLEGEGLPPDECPICEWQFCDYTSEHLTEAGYKAAITIHRQLVERARTVAAILDCDHASTTFEFNSYADRPGATFTAKWIKWPRDCRYDSAEEEEQEIPLRYLWMSNDDIRMEEARKQGERIAKMQEETRRKDLEAAENELIRAEARAATAAKDAARELAEAREKVAKLRGAR